jgi:DNA/RNA-binding domain of Phe-tRNA-synthetase-like protein
MLSVSSDWKEAYPGAFAGVLVLSDVENPETHPELDRKKKELEEDLRTLFKDKDQLRSQATLRAYKDFYKRFKKTYHVQQQLESVIFKGKSIPKVATLVEAMFMAELRNALLTAGHDMDAVKEPLTLDAAKGQETFIRINGQEQKLKQGDMMISDTEGIISSVVYGPDKRTRITGSTTRALFTTYAVPGVSEQALRQHLEGVAANVRIVAPDAQTDLLEICSAK